jgi:hypothetical protein
MPQSINNFLNLLVNECVITSSMNLMRGCSFLAMDLEQDVAWIHVQLADYCIKERNPWQVPCGKPNYTHFSEC